MALVSIAIAMAPATSVGCAGTAAPGTDTAGDVLGPGLPVPLAVIVGGRPAPADDTFEVWVCEVPAGIDDALYDRSSLRAELTPADVVARIGVGLTTYFGTISHDRYRPGFTAGGTVSIATTDSSDRCISAALAGASGRADAVLVVATAQHAGDQAGGRATPGGWLTCTDACSAGSTGRFVYVGANDFLADATGSTPLDLIEHEIGHSLGLPHSGDAVGATGNRGVGPYDVMADPAAPRAIDPARRDAPDIVAIDRVDLGWLPLADVEVVDARELVDRPTVVTSTTALVAATTVRLAPSTGSHDTRLLVIAIDDHRMLTAELRLPTGYDDHLSRAGVVVHLIDDSPAQCGATTVCTDLERVQQIVPADGDTTTLLAAGDTATTGGVRLTVVSIDGSSAMLTVAAG